MLLNYVQTGLVWYYINTLAVAYIIYMLLRIALARAQKVTVNQSESASKEDRQILRLIIFISIFGIMFFILREYTSVIREMWVNVIEWAQELIYG